MYIKMSNTFLVFAGHRSAYRCIQQRCVPYLYKSVIKDTNVHSAMQYCISVKGKDVNLSKVEDFKYRDVTNAKSLDRNIISEKVIEQSIDELSNDVYNKERSNRFISKRELFRKDNLISKRVERLYPQPKNSLLEIYRTVCQEQNDQTLLTSSYKQDPTSRLWEFIYHVKWPQTMSFKAVSVKKSTADKNAALKCLEWLEVNCKLKDGKPILYSMERIREMQSKSCELRVAPEILDDMENLIDTYEKNNILSLGDSSVTFTYNMHTIAPNLDAFGYANESMTSQVVRNRTLQSRLTERRVHHADLPIFEFRDKILSTLEHSRVLLIEGDTGCGKSTQVPQFILDSYARDGKATDCNILVSQPRKISAISLADRVAHERGEILRDVVGYQVRLENETPNELGRILYCTTGILLKKLQCTPNLKGCSHVILDEAHERSIDTDMLMILLKRTLNLNPDIKVVIMSATINTQLFREYFNCSVVKVPGRLYPVKMNFMEDIENLPDFHRYEPYMCDRHASEKPNAVDHPRIVQVIKWISTNKPHGAILCFLPGWADIMRVQSMLGDDPLCSQKQLVLPIHSKESHEAQRRIFRPVPEGTRKIILATDIAETGITVPDVCYVVDSVLRRDVRWDDTKNLLCVNNDWVTKANIQQRKGRAGRVRPGESYHLIKRTDYDQLREYPVAQVLCTSLEKTILESKSYTDEKAEDFLSGLLEPPTTSRVQKGVDYLMDLGVLDKEENLTALGKRMTAFTTHPKFSKALVYSTIFNCIHPVVTIASIFSGEDSPFYDVLSEKSKIRDSKITYHPLSDHHALSWIFKTWYMYNLEKPRSATKFCVELNLRPKRINVLSMIREIFVQQMIACRLLSSNETYSYEDPDVVANKYENNDELVSAILYSATQQLIEHKNVGFKNGVLRTGINELRVRGKIKAMISGDSVNYKRKDWPSPYLTYFTCEHCNTKQRAVIRETSMISPLTVLLFNQREVQRHERHDRTEIQVTVDKEHIINFSSDKRTADVLLKFRDIMWSTVQYILERECEYENYGSKVMSEYKNQLLETLAKALDASSEHTYGHDI